MSRKTVFITLSALLLLQVSWGKPESGTEPKSSQSSEESGEVNPKVAELRKSMSQDLTTFMDYTSTKSEKLFKDILADVSTKEDNTKEENNLRTKIISDIVEEIEKTSTSDKIQQKYETMLDIFNVVEQFELTRKEKPTDEDRVYNNYFIKHGIETYSNLIIPKLKEFFDKTDINFEKFWNDLSMEEQTEYKKFNDWHQKFKAARDPVHKLDIMTGVFSL